jgi:hypothetical protein
VLAARLTLTKRRLSKEGTKYPTAKKVPYCKASINSIFLEGHARRNLACTQKCNHAHYCRNADVLYKFCESDLPDPQFSLPMCLKRKQRG